MMEIVNFVIGSGKTRRDREAARKSIARVLDAMEASGSITKTPSPYARGGYATYKLNSAEARESPEAEKFGILGRVSHAELRAIQKSAREIGAPDPLRAFTQHRAHAQARGIEFHMTFCEWWGIWKDRYTLRGNGPDDLCMGRFGDVGPYAVGNVYITSNRENLRDYYASEKKKRDAPALKERRSRRLRELIDEIESLPPPLYSYEQVVAMLKLGVPFELRPNSRVGHRDHVAAR